MTVILSIVLVILLAYSVIVTIVTKRSIMRIREYEEFYDEMSDEVETSLRVMKASISSIEDSMKSPVMFDDPIVHRIIGNIKNAFSSVCMVELKLSSFFDRIDNDDNDVESLTKEDKDLIVNFLESGEVKDVKR